MKQNYIAVDLGAESGRVMLGTLAGGTMSLAECHRFGNGPIEEDGALRWDFGPLMAEITEGIGKAVKAADGKVTSVAVDSWGVDFGLLDEAGELIENPYHYRDSRTTGMPEKAYELLSKRDIYELTGIQLMQINSIFQLFAMRQENSPSLAKAKRLLYMADLVSYFLCGEAFCEYTLGSTSQLMDMRTGQWSKGVFEGLGLPLAIMPKVVPPASRMGQVKAELAKEWGCEPFTVIAAGSHDTASAVAAVPVESERWAYLSCGTWSLMGVETPKAVINESTYTNQFTNEGGVLGTIRLLKNIMGLWIVQECKRQWKKEGNDYSYAELTSMAGSAERLDVYIDPDYNEFLTPGEMPSKINRYLASVGKAAIEDKGQMVRTVLESLSVKYLDVLTNLEETIGSKVDVLHMVGGGTKNEMLCQFTANSIGRKVVAGPIEATACGNIMLQALATGGLESLAEGRAMVGRSFERKEYLPA